VQPLRLLGNRVIARGDQIAIDDRHGGHLTSAQHDHAVDQRRCPSATSGSQSRWLPLDLVRASFTLSVHAQRLRSAFATHARPTRDPLPVPYQATFALLANPVRTRFAASDEFPRLPLSYLVNIEEEEAGDERDHPHHRGGHGRDSR
jgi:hypothetical protein